MHWLQSVTSFDVVVFVVLCGFLLRGAWIGFLRQLAPFLALFLGYWLVNRYFPMAQDRLQAYPGDPRIQFLAAFLVLFGVLAVCFGLAGRVLQKVMDVTMLGWFDRGLGLMLGAAKGAFVVCVLYMFLASSLSATNDLLRRSRTTPYLARGAAWLQDTLRVDQRLRDLFAPKKPAIESGQPAGEVRRQAI